MNNTQAAVHLRTIADQLDALPPTAFGGVFVAIPHDGEPTDAFVVSSKPDLALFWATVEGKVAIAKAEIEQQSYGQVTRRR